MRCLFARQLHPPVYDAIIHAASERGIRPLRIRHVTAPEEAFPFHCGRLGRCLCSEAWCFALARSGMTVRPLNESSLRLKTCLVCRADDAPRSQASSSAHTCANAGREEISTTATPHFRIALHLTEPGFLRGRAQMERKVLMTITQPDVKIEPIMAAEKGGRQTVFIQSKAHWGSERAQTNRHPSAPARTLARRKAEVVRVLRARAGIFSVQTRVHAPLVGIH